MHLVVKLTLESKEMEGPNIGRLLMEKGHRGKECGDIFQARVFLMKKLSQQAEVLAFFVKRVRVRLEDIHDINTKFFYHSVGFCGNA